MTIYQLTEDISFPDPELANNDGLLAVDGDLSSERILSAYSQGIFPWYSEGSRLLWWSPNPRLILYPSKIKISKSLKRTINSKKYICKFDTNFEAVINGCANITRDEDNGIWLVDEMIEAYTKLHKLGYAHSVETYYNKELVGGLYGLSLGKCFFGESMFFKKSDASKVALSYLCRELKAMGFYFIDAQVETDHLVRMGAQKIKRNNFLELLDQALEHPTCVGKWTKEI
ncbi:MAG: leucyl/phenylalanyl-tRNA--protein transferase [Bacteroidales bacterium]|nr:leucyl/phenylalanyl-tRNA--protein transferase [Bacteroidales bacterium]RLD37803.1 MAG: leucyl/phenylalanyl-tRNA--protein transferase [Bacteroidota bacterium]